LCFDVEKKSILKSSQKRRGVMRGRKSAAHARRRARAVPRAQINRAAREKARAAQFTARAARDIPCAWYT